MAGKTRYSSSSDRVFFPPGLMAPVLPQTKPASIMRNRINTCLAVMRARSNGGFSPFLCGSGPTARTDGRKAYRVSSMRVTMSVAVFTYSVMLNFFTTSTS